MLYSYKIIVFLDTENDVSVMLLCKVWYRSTRLPSLLSSRGNFTLARYVHKSILTFLLHQTSTKKTVRRPSLFTNFISDIPQSHPLAEAEAEAEQARYHEVLGIYYHHPCLYRSRRQNSGTPSSTQGSKAWQRTQGSKKAWQRTQGSKAWQCTQGPKAWHRTQAWQRTKRSSCWISRMQTNQVGRPLQLQGCPCHAHKGIQGRPVVRLLLGRRRLRCHRVLNAEILRE